MEEKFKLPSRRVTVKFVPRKKGMAANVDDNHVIAGGMLPNAKDTFYCPLQRSGGIANILSKKEKEYLEQELGLDLSVYGDFWKTFNVKLGKSDAGNRFDTSNPLEFISLRILEQYTDQIAPSWKERKNKPSYKYAITEQGEEQDEKKIKLDLKKEAFKKYGRIEEDKDALIGVLKLLENKPISKESKLSWIQGQVEAFLDQHPGKFVQLMTDPYLETKLLLNKAVEAGAVKKNGNSYRTIDGLDLCNSGQKPTFNNAVRFLNEDKNQEVRLLIESRIENSN